uniref:Uncharacterized protein n=1 Tax=Chromera velia CCMP2878 TaxID=1169474 RepID=A0A0G4FYQ7_9ALVE|mmetsp:Transcript_21223/g.42177  ORF Transcript_21223/g.42177 Transcript_21223/m.42177 type:complete len:155 (-) Transcript_21223:529-993(-)|eukprot:Cvel_19421.t1-p1 / transcript=Cvel_19421.t1 / gene=Cvel_19421 / organism=Chromera_velia_CCMP2878 / gene_product=hypothetical protein / transcript_product=hypothetical protein / location=Cvel_scaffold1673:764-1497(-) / protein_length=154 / sequence_SO=supercontig / SO=protein_coding / is_pseudo=false
MDETEKAVHLLPCKIDFDGRSEVKEFFFSTVAVDSSASSSASTLEADFRGRHLRGQKIPLGSPHCSCQTVTLEEKMGSFDRLKGPSAAAERVELNDHGEETDFSILAKSSVGKKVVTTKNHPSLVYWNHDANPSETDDVPQLFHLMELNAALHS